MKRILFICHGNICRSTMAQFVMMHLVRERGLEHEFAIDSAATTNEDVGSIPHRGTRFKLAQQGIECGEHYARQMTRADYADFDLIIGMDSENMHGMRRIAGGDPQGKLHLLLDWTARPRDIADPWYTGNFDATYDDVLEGCTALLAALVD